MLPKIPYEMQKNKSQVIPMRSVNFGSATEPGELSDSLGISTRKFPHLTTRRGDSLIDQYEDVHAMTIFNGTLITVRGPYERTEESEPDSTVTYFDLYAGAENIISLDGTVQRRFAAINTKLVIFPDNIYIEQVGGNWKSRSLGIPKNIGKAIFASNSVSCGSDAVACSGYGGELLESGIFRISPPSNKTLTGSYYVGADGYIATAELISFDSISIKVDISQTVLIVNCRGCFDDTTFSSIKKLLIITSSGSYIGEVEKSNNAYWNETAYIPANFKCERINGLDTGTDVTFLYWLEAPCNYPLSSAFSTASGPRFARVTTADGKDIISGNIGASRERYVNLKDVDCGESYKNKVYSGQVNVYLPGWSQSFVASGIVTDDEISFSCCSGIFTVSSVDNWQIKLYSEEEYEVFDIPEDTEIIIYRHLQDPSIFSEFKVGDTVEISGCSISENNTAFNISKIDGGSLYSASEIFTIGTSDSDVVVARRCPELDFACEKDNRLYGVNNENKTIHVSALGDPTNMFTSEGVATDAFAVPVGGEGDFTACCKYGDAVLFFKEDKLYRLVGSYPAEFALYSCDVDGVARGSEKSCVVINEVLYYMGRDGVYAYSGGIPLLISACFGERKFKNAVGGSDGRYYYLSVEDENNTPLLFTYDTRTQLWLIEQKVRCLDFARTREGLHYASGGGVYRVGAGDSSGEWLARWAPIYELIDGKRSYSRILLRVLIPRGSYIKIRLRFDGGDWRNAGTIVGKTENVIPLRIPVNRCDRFELELSGKGECTILDIMREYHVGSEV